MSVLIFGRHGGFLRVNAVPSSFFCLPRRIEIAPSLKCSVGHNNPPDETTPGIARAR